MLTQPISSQFCCSSTVDTKRNVLYFTMRDFATITGLKCTDSVNDGYISNPESTKINNIRPVWEISAQIHRRRKVPTNRSETAVRMQHRRQVLALELIRTLEPKFQPQQRKK